MYFIPQTLFKMTLLAASCQLTQKAYTGFTFLWQPFLYSSSSMWHWSMCPRNVLGVWRHLQMHLSSWCIWSGLRKR